MSSSAPVFIPATLPAAARRARVHAALDRRLGSPGRTLANRSLDALCILVSAVVLVPLLSLVFLLLERGLPLVSWHLFTELPPAPGLTGGGLGNALIGSALMVGMALALATPVGILAAVYLCEYRPASRLSHATRFAAKLLAGLPSIICGVFAFAVVVLTMGHFSAFAGSVALAVLALPTILLTAEQALRAVPAGYREASAALGATRFQTIRNVVLPQAAPAIMTGVMLALARAAGETAPVLFTALFNSYWSVSPVEPAASLSTLIYNCATLPYDYQIRLAWTASLVLVTLVTLANVAAQAIFRRHPGGAA
jgi:phosphate transport system permease protein